MAEKAPDNCEGRFFVDTHCINCSLCPEIAAGIFATNHEAGYEYVARQPETEQEFQRVAEAIALCPASAIQDNG